MERFEIAKFKMECPYLETGAFRPVCGASPARRTPDEHEAGAYCTTEEHYNCPALLGHVLRGGVSPGRSRAFRRLRLCFG